MPSREALCGSVAKRIHQLRPPRRGDPLYWLEKLSQKPLLAATSIALAVSLHLWCCDWRLPTRQYVGGGKHAYVFFDNQLVGLIHAGEQFRTPAAGGAWYDLENAFWVGLYLPLLIAFPGVMAVLSALAPEECRVLVRRCRARVLGENEHPVQSALAAAVLVLVVAVPGAIGSAYVADSESPVFVEATKDPLSKASSDSGEGFWASLGFGGSGQNQPLSSGSSSPSSGTTYNTTPEPSTLAMLLSLGLVVLLASVWRRRKARV